MAPRAMCHVPCDDNRVTPESARLCTIAATSLESDTVQAQDTSSGAETAVRQPHLFLIFRCDQPLEHCARFALDPVDQLIIGRGERASVHRAEGGTHTLHVTVPDAWMSVAHARLSQSLSRWVLDDERSRNGTFVNGARARNRVLEDGDLIEIGHCFFLFRRALPIVAADRVEADKASSADPVLTTLLPVLARDFSALGKVAQSAESVVILGETGTGKELAARTVHRLSGRKGAFVGVNCGGLAPSLIHSELFGYLKGAFSGATADRLGFVRSADRGTLFLDEIVDLPAEAQVAVLRVLEERAVVPVGGTQPIAVDFRLCVASQRALGEPVGAGTFREDLWARLSGFTLRLPPLRRRMEDFGLLVASILERRAASDATFSTRAARMLLRHGWPQNIRELDKCLGTALALADGHRIRSRHLLYFQARSGTSSEASGDVAPPPPPPPPSASGPEDRLKQLTALLERHGGNVSEVARAMGKSRFQVRRWLKRYRLDLNQFRNR